MIDADIRMSVQNLVVRDLEEYDLETMLKIRLNPMVREFLDPAKKLTIAKLRTQFLQPISMFGVNTKCSTVVLDGERLGFIDQTWITTRTGTKCMCGWFLHPKVWGRGIMPAALNMLFDEIFQSEKILEIDAMCFDDNKRCIRLLKNLNFETKPPVYKLGNLFSKILRMRPVTAYVLRKENFRRTSID